MNQYSAVGIFWSTMNKQQRRFLLESLLLPPDEPDELRDRLELTIESDGWELLPGVLVHLIMEQLPGLFTLDEDSQHARILLAIQEWKKGNFLPPLTSK